MAETRIIKRYANRKLYDTEHSRYVTLEQISEMIRAGDEVKIVDNKTKEDLTTVTLAQIIFEEEKKQRSFMPLGTMRNIIQHGGEWLAEAQRKVQAMLPIIRKEGDEEGVADATPDVASSASVAPTAAAASTELDDESTSKKNTVIALREWVEHSKTTLDDWQKKVDEKIRTALDGMSPFAGVHKDVKVLSDRIAELEAKLSELEQQK